MGQIHCTVLHMFISNTAGLCVMCMYTHTCIHVYVYVQCMFRNIHVHCTCMSRIATECSGNPALHCLPYTLIVSLNHNPIPLLLSCNYILRQETPREGNLGQYSTV